MAHVVFDLRDILKSLRRTPGYTLTVVATLALTIGATTAVFSIVNGVLLKPLAYRESHRLVALREVWKEFSKAGSAMEVNEQHFEYWRQHATSFESMAQFIDLPANLTGLGEAAQVVAVHASGSIFDVLQIQPLLGRQLTADDESVERPRVAVISNVLWRQRFAGDPQVIGRSLVLDGKPHTIVGVLPADVRIPLRSRLSDKFDAIVPIRMPEEHVGWVGEHNDDAIARLKAGVTIDRALAELNVLQSQVSKLATAQAHEPITMSADLQPLTDDVVGSARRGLLLLFGAIAAVLLIACSNLANLALTRTLARQREMAIRAALGASRSRLVWRSIAEQLVIAGVGGGVGLGVAAAALRIFVRTAPVDLPRISDVALDASVLAFAAAVSVGAGLIVAIIPASRLASRAVQAALRASGTAFTSDRAAGRARASLLAVQVAVSVTLLVVTSLLSVSFIRVMNVDRGFASGGVLSLNIAMPADRYRDDNVRLATYDRVLTAIGALPGVATVTTTTMTPLTGSGQVNMLARENETRPMTSRPSANFRYIAPDFFRTLGMSMLRGRSFTASERDPNRPAPAVISQNVANRLWPGEDPIGKRFSRGQSGEQGFEVVGVVGDARMTSLERQPVLMVYVPYWWRNRTAMTLLVKTTLDATALAPAVRGAIATVDRDIAVSDARALDRVVDTALAPRRYQMQLFVAFGLAALAIAIIGVYATTAYGVSRRRREMNIRVALGAQRANVMALIVRQAGSPIAVGLLAGAIGAIAVGGVVASLLFEVRARDPLVIAAVVAIVGTVGLLACVTATRQGLVIDPAAALREE